MNRADQINKKEKSKKKHKKHIDLETYTFEYTEIP